MPRCAFPIPRDASRKTLESPGGLGHVVRIPLLKDREEIGLLEAASTGSYLTGETSAALEFLAEQLPPMADLCRLIEEKLRLERELAERERLAFARADGGERVAQSAQSAELDENGIAGAAREAGFAGRYCATIAHWLSARSTA